MPLAVIDMIEPINLWTMLLNDKDEELCRKLEGKLHAQNLDIRDAYCFPFDYRDRFESIAGCLKKMIDSSDVGKKLKIDTQLAIEIQRIASALCYLLNSNSLRTGKYQDYDRYEIDMKLSRV